MAFDCLMLALKEVNNLLEVVDVANKNQKDTLEAVGYKIICYASGETLGYSTASEFKLSVRAGYINTTYEGPDPETNIYKLTALEYRTQEQYDALDPLQQSNMDAEKVVYDAFVANKADEVAAKAALSENEHFQTLDNLGLIGTLTL